MLKVPSRLVPEITRYFRKHRPVSSCALANMITREMVISRPEFRMLRQNITRCLDMMKGPGTQYDAGDVEALFDARAHFQSRTGMNRETPRVIHISPQKAAFNKQFSGWLRSKHIQEYQFAYALMKLLSRPCTDAEISRNFDVQGEHVKDLFSYEVFMSIVRKSGLRLGFVGSIADGTFDAFSDIDICWQTRDGSNVLPFRPSIMSNMGNAWLVDMWYGNIVSSWDTKMSEGPLIQLSQADIHAFASRPGYLRRFYRAYHRV